MSSPHDRPDANGPRRFPWITATLLALAGAAWVEPRMTWWLAWDREAIAFGQWWRHLTGHLTHWSTDHAIWDMLGFAALGTLIESRHRIPFAACCLASAIGISLAIDWLEPGMAWYRGLSGLDAALFAMLCATAMAKSSNARWLRWTGALGIAIAAAQTLYLHHTGGAWLVDQQAARFQPLMVAHAVGLIVGAVFGAWVGVTSAGPRRDHGDREATHRQARAETSARAASAIHQ